MHITWVVSGSIEKRSDGSMYSPMASVRYRVLYVAEHLARRQHRVDIVQSGLPAGAPELTAPLKADVVIVSKGLFHESTAIVERAQRLGARVIVDLCDDHFDSPYRDTYFSLCRLADRIIASTPAMAEVIAQRTTRKADIIGDPYEAPLDEPRFNPADRIRLLWFGHPSNFDTLAAMMPKLITFSKERPVDLHVVSEAVPNVVRELNHLREKHAPRLTARFSKWTPETTWQAMADCDIVVIPSLHSDAKRVKSPNRLIESLRRGRFVCAYPLPSYQQFSPYCWLGDNVLEGVRWALVHPREALARIRDGQAMVSEEFAPAKLAQQWEQAILRYAASRPVSFPRASFAGILAGSMASARL